MQFVDDAAFRQAVLSNNTVGHTTEWWHLLVLFFIMAAVVLYLEYRAEKGKLPQRG